jgi:hypothetical protein
MRATASALLLSLLYTAPAAAQVSATASPVSNSSGSVVNQAVQISIIKSLFTTTVTTLA